MDRESRIQHEKKSSIAVPLNLSGDQPFYYPKNRFAVIRRANGTKVDWCKIHFVPSRILENTL
jgi:hypothetical protein